MADPLGVVIRRAAPMDDVVPVVHAAFGAEDPAAGTKVGAVWSELELSPHLRGSLVAELGHALVGHVGLSHAWLDARRALVEVWMLSPLSVLPAHQGQGIGTALVAAAVEVVRESGAPMLVLEGDPGYYGARGFGPASTYGVEPASRRTPGPACQVVALDAWEPWMSGRLVYPELWWRHDSVGLRDPALAEVESALGVPPA